MQVLRFDFYSLQDFRIPPNVVFADVDAAEPEEITPPPPPPPPTFSEQELEAAKSKSREEGRQAGIAEGMQKAQHEHAQRDAAIMQSMGQLVAQLDRMHRWQTDTMQHQCAELGTLVRMVAHKVAGDAIALLPEASVEQLVRDCLGVLIRVPKAVLHVHPQLQPSMNERMQQQLKKLRSNCTLDVLADESVGLGEGRLEWQSGHAERSMEELWSEIEQKLASTDFSSLASAPQTIVQAPVPVPANDTASSEVPSETPSNNNDQQGESV